MKDIIDLIGNITLYGLGGSLSFIFIYQIIKQVYNDFKNLGEDDQWKATEWKSILQCTD